MAEQKLDSPKISCSPVDQHCLRPTQRVRAELRRVETDAGHPFLHEPRVLPGGQSIAVTTPGKQELTRCASCQAQILVDRLAGLIGQLKPNRPTGFLLSDRGAIHRIAARGDVLHAYRDDVATAQLAVDRQVEEGQIPLLALDLQLGPDRPHVARAQRWLSTDELALVPRHASGFGCGFSGGGLTGMVFHVLSPCFERQSSMRFARPNLLI